MVGLIFFCVLILYSWSLVNSLKEFATGEQLEAAAGLQLSDNVLEIIKFK